MADVLIVEDIALQASLLRRYLSGVHTVVGVAETATEAVELAAEADPHVIVMDLNLKSGDSASATAEITDSDPSTAVVISTVAVGDETIERAMEVGAEEFLIKPYDRQELLEAIERAT
jgi:two-component system chemotaxis response regulator CheY